MTDNPNWLAEYVRTGSDAAFRELVTRYVDLVYSTALRLVNSDAHRAEDVTQTVFLNLARVARTLPQDIKLGGWLHRDTCFTASTLMRGERRRQNRERQAVEMNALDDTSAADYSLIVPVLDEAINELGDEDRMAILLRFFEQNDFRSVGAVLGSTEDAARMRVTRALEKLETFLKRRGITTTAASLGVVLSANAVQAAPVGLALTISAAAVLTGTTLATTATVTATKAIAMTALQKTIVTATIAVLAGAGIYEAHQALQLHEQVQTLQQQQVPIEEQIEQLNKALTDATNQIAGLSYENQRLNSNTGELLRLRGELAQLKAATNFSSTLTTSNNPMMVEIEFWLSRIETIKQRLKELPEKQIPEFQFMPEREWMMVAQHLNIETNLNSVVDIAQQYAKKNCGLAFLEALQKYMTANDQKFPPNFQSLQSYLPQLSDASVFQNYQITQAMLKTEIDADRRVEHQAYRPSQATAHSEWIIMQKGALYDSDTQLVVTSSGLRFQNFPTK